MSSLTTFNVSDVIQTLANSLGLNVEVDGIDDVCFGLVISSDKSFVDFCNTHRGPYNFQVIDGDPIKIVRRAVGDSLTIDFNINETDCIARNGPAIQYNRIDIENLPREIEIQYLDPDRQFSFNVQKARHAGARRRDSGTRVAYGHTYDASKTSVIQTVTLDFVLDADTARTMAFDYLYRIWSQQLSISFEHKDLRIEPGDVIKLTADQGIFTVLVQESTITKARTNLIAATVLLTSTLVSSGQTVTGVSGDPYVQDNTASDYAAWMVAA